MGYGRARRDIRGGTVIDGTGVPRRTADVAIRDGVITVVGAADGAATREINADGAVVAPGSSTCTPTMTGRQRGKPRCSLVLARGHHGRSATAGRFGAGPRHGPRATRPTHGRREDILGTALHEGLAWNWNSFRASRRTRWRQGHGHRCPGSPCSPVAHDGGAWRLGGRKPGRHCRDGRLRPRASKRAFLGSPRAERRTTRRHSAS